MAFLRTVSNSSFWLAVFVDDMGRKTNRSTKLKATAKNRAEAMKMALAWEEAARQAKAGELTAAAAGRTLAAMVERSSGETMAHSTVRRFLEDWLASRKGKVSEPSLARYKPVLTRFTAFMGKRADKSLRGVTPGDVEQFQRHLLDGGQSAGTANFGVKILRIAFRSAHTRGQIPINPAAAVEMLDDDGQEKQPFTIGQVQQLLAVADDDWKGMILLGSLGGLRLADAANLARQSVNDDAGTITFVPMKTARRRKGVPMVIAAHPEFLAWLKGRPPGGQESDPLFPALHGKQSGKWGGLSNMFSRIQKAAGIESAATRKSRKGGRAFFPLSFHSLRHHFVSELLNQSVPADVRKMMAGHSCDRAHSVYTHLSLETQRKAIGTHPGFTSALQVAASESAIP